MRVEVMGSAECTQHLSHEYILPWPQWSGKLDCQRGHEAPSSLDAGRIAMPPACLLGIIASDALIICTPMHL